MYCTDYPIATGYLSFAASEIAADEIAAKNWPPMHRADILNNAVRD